MASFMITNYTAETLYDYLDLKAISTHSPFV